MMAHSDYPYIFIVGSPRSGTTILGEILDIHSEINQWYEPYFIWDKFFRLSAHDERTELDATPEVIQYIQGSFERYRTRSGCRFLVDKSPRNSLKIPFIKKIFPHARFIHIVRDGRDATLSINREWVNRIKIVQGSKNRSGFDYQAALKVIGNWLERQPFMADRFRALWFETQGHLFNKKKHTNRLRWNGMTGWGPRFREWDTLFACQSILEFNAHQWEKCVEACIAGLDLVNSSQKITLQYESFVQQPVETLQQVLEFISAKNTSDFYIRLPEIKKGNFNKWKTAFAEDEISAIKPILSPMLEELGYLKKWPWL